MTKSKRWVEGAVRWCWVSSCTVWLSHSQWPNLLAPHMFLSFFGRTLYHPRSSVSLIYLVCCNIWPFLKLEKPCVKLQGDYFEEDSGPIALGRLPLSVTLNGWIFSRKISQVLGWDKLLWSDFVSQVMEIYDIYAYSKRWNLSMPFYMIRVWIVNSKCLR